MADLVDLPLKDFIQAVAAKTPTPGGGSVAAATAALGAALGVMVARYSKGEACAGAAADLEKGVADPAEVEPPLDEARREKLRALGYLE